MSILVTRLRRVGIFASRSYELVKLATPMILARGGLILMVTADIVMVGHYGAQDLAYQAMGLTIIMPMIVIGMGMLTGTLVISASNFGASAYTSCGAAWRRSIPFAIILGLIGLTVTTFGESILLGLGQTAELAKHGGNVLLILGIGLPAFYLFLTSEMFLEGIRRPGPAMVIMLVANIVNVGLNWVLIFGNFGAPDLGASGAAWATTLSRIVAAIALVIYICRMRNHDRYGIRRGATTWGEAWRRQCRIGYATSVSVGGESCAFAVLHIFAGWMGPLFLAAFSVTFNLLTIVFMLALGLGAATAVRVGNAHGSGDPEELMKYGWIGLSTNSMVMVGIGLAFILLPTEIIGLFTDESSLAAVGVPLVIFAAYLLVVDGGQAVIANALRGRQDIWVPCFVQLFSYFGLMVPIAYYFAFVHGLGAIGLLYGVLIGSGFSVTVLSWRFHQLARSDQHRIVRSVPAI